MNAAQRNAESEARLTQSRVKNAEKNLGLLCDTFGSVTRKNARLRNKGDLFSRHLISYAEGSEFNSSSRHHLVQFAENYSAVQDYCHAKVQRLENKVLKSLMKYGDLCKHLKKHIKSELSVFGKEKKAEQKLQKLRGKPDSSLQTAQVETELQRLRLEKERSRDAVAAEVDSFEAQRIADVKHILGEMVKIEMTYHAKALEQLSRCFADVQQISVEADVHEYQTAMERIRGKASRSSMQSPGVASVESPGVVNPPSSLTFQRLRAEQTFESDSDSEQEIDITNMFRASSAGPVPRSYPGLSTQSSRVRISSGM